MNRHVFHAVYFVYLPSQVTLVAAFVPYVAIQVLQETMEVVASLEHISQKPGHAAITNIIILFIAAKHYEVMVIYIYIYII